MYDYDVLFLGSGHAAWHGALKLVMAGKKVAFVDGDLIGGTCTNYGCDAKILLDAPFAFVNGLKRYKGIGVESTPEIDWTALMKYKKQVISPLPAIMALTTELLQLSILLFLTLYLHCQELHRLEYL